MKVLAYTDIKKTPEKQMIIENKMPDAPIPVRVIIKRPPPSKSVKKLDFSSL